jgi:hypothetical protein
MPTRSLSGIFASLLLAAGCTVGVGTVDPGEGGEGEEQEPPPTDPTVKSIMSGSFAPLPGTTGISGRAQMVRWLSGDTSFDAQILGLTPGVTYTSHVHAASCAFQGGGHYKIDPAVIDTIETNELWLEMTASADGIGQAYVEFPHAARGEALSIVIHNPDGGAKMACADLLADDTGPVMETGTVAPFAAAEAIDQGIGGGITMMRDGSGTHISLNLTGLDPATIYGTHIHAQPCEVTDGGGHYKLDPTVVDVIETNELWPAVQNYESGSMSSTYDSPHLARYDAQSVVVHRTVDELTKPKVACANLIRAAYPGVGTSGEATVLPAAEAKSLAITGSATMSRTLAGITQVQMNVAGLEPGVDYSTHVHNLPCSVQDGGGHYLIDTTVTDVVEENEHWLLLQSDDAGAATASKWIDHVARGDAQSIVIHDPADKARLACFDLN